MDIFPLTCATDMEKMEAVLDDPYILITDKKICKHSGNPSIIRADRTERRKTY